MTELCYVIRNIPDLTLGKYSYLSENGVDGVLKLHNSFLWNLHEKSILSNVSFHLFYFYDKDGPLGDKMKIYFIAQGSEGQLENIDSIISAAPLSDYFIFENLNDIDKTESDDKFQQVQFQYCSTFSKEEIFFTGSDGKDYYDIPLWKCDEKGRLFSMFRMMEALDEDMVFRIDIKAEKKNRLLRKKLSSGPIPNLHSLQSNTKGEKDYGADSVLKDYDELLKALDSTPHFNMNAFVLSNNKQNGNMVLASALSEGIDKGDYVISTFKDTFKTNIFLDDVDVKLCDYSDESNEYFIEKNKKGLKVYSEKLVKSNCSTLGFLNTLFTLEEILPFFRLPCLYDGETIVIRKETVAPLVPDDNALYLGLDENGYKINFPIELLPKHAFVSGVPGSGKTNTMHHITNSLLEKDIPFLVLEPAKKEYRALCNTALGKKKLRLFSPGSNMKFPLHINPFEFAKGLPVAEHIRSLCSVFEGAFPLDNPMPFLLDTAIEGVYRDNGWSPETVYTDDVKLPFPTMSQLYKRLEEELAQTTYSTEVRGNLESALKVRIGGLLRREMGDVFDVPKSSLSPEEWLTTPVVVELESMGSGPSNFLTLMLCSLIRECLKVNPTFDSKKTRHVIFIEEAHNLIGPDSEEKTGDGANAKTAATAFIVKMLAEVRALRESVFIADQLPTAMAQEVIKNTGLKIALRLTAMDDRQILCNSMSANNSQIENMATFRVGEALITYEKLQRPFKMRIHEWGAQLSKEEKAKITVPKNDEDLFNVLKNTEIYQDNIIRSIIIFAMNTERKYEKLVEEYNDFGDDFEKYIKQCIKIKQNKDEFQNNENRLLEIEKDYQCDPNIAYDFSEEYRNLILIRKSILENQGLLKKELKPLEAKLVDDKLILQNFLSFTVDVCKKIQYYKEQGIDLTIDDFNKFMNGEVDSMSTAIKMASYLRFMAQETLIYANDMCEKIKEIDNRLDTKKKILMVAKKTGLQMI